MANLTILVVDDDHDMRVCIRETLESADYLVSTAANGRDALDRLRSGLSPALILLDLDMPVMNGLTFLRQKEADPRLVLIISGHEKDRVDAKYALLPKPMKDEDLLRAVAAALK